MSIEQPDKVDFIGRERASGDFVLTISDHLDWSDRVSHLAALETKLEAYVAFIDSGELLQHYPDAKEHQVRIRVLCKFPPHADARAVAAHMSLTSGFPIAFVH